MITTVFTKHEMGLFVSENFHIYETQANSADPDQMPQNVVSDQGLHCLFNKNLNKMKNTIQQPLKRKWTGLIGNSGKFHSA